jgi:hypothetical protein
MAGRSCRARSALGGSPVGWCYRAGGTEPSVLACRRARQSAGRGSRIVRLYDVAGQGGQPVLGGRCRGGSTGGHRVWPVRDDTPDDAAMATAVPGHGGGGGGWSSEAPASMRLRSPAPLRHSGTSLCSSSDTGGEASLLSRRRFMGIVRMCRSRAGPGPVFRVVMFVINGSCPSSFPAVRRASPADSAGRKGDAAGGRRR